MANGSDLLKGFAAFVKAQYEGYEATMPQLVAEGQNPDYMIISCIDSRSNPSTIFQAQPGTFFAHKAMGAIVRPYHQGTALSATLQFAVKHNKVKTIIVLGHTGCGAIKALIERIDDDEITSFIEVAQSSLDKARTLCCASKDTPMDAQLQRKTEEQIILQSVENLKGYPAVKEALANGDVEILPWLFCMEEGTIYAFNAATQRFEKTA